MFMEFSRAELVAGFEPFGVERVSLDQGGEFQL